MEIPRIPEEVKGVNNQLCPEIADFAKIDAGCSGQFPEDRPFLNAPTPDTAVNDKLLAKDPISEIKRNLKAADLKNKEQDNQEDEINLSDDEPSVDENGVNTGRWTSAEHKRLLDALAKFGNDWKKVCDYVKTRSACQARSHAQKYFSKMKLKAICKIKNDTSGTQKLFVIIREYLNRTVAPARLLEVPDETYKLRKKKNLEKEAETNQEKQEAPQQCVQVPPISVPQQLQPLPQLQPQQMQHVNTPMIAMPFPMIAVPQMTYPQPMPAFFPYYGMPQFYPNDRSSHSFSQQY